MTAKERWEHVGLVALGLGLTWCLYACLAWAFVGVVWLPYYALTGSTQISHAFSTAYQPRLLASIASVCLALLVLFCIWQLIAGMFAGLQKMASQ